MNDDTVWISTDFILGATPAETKVRMVALDLAFMICHSGRGFRWDPAQIAEHLRTGHPNRARSVRWLKRHEAELRALFVETASGLYPSPIWFSEGSGEAVDG